MKLGLSLPMFTADVGRPLDGGGASGRRGLRRGVRPDHLFPPGAPGRPALEPFAILAAVAARHPELHVGTLVSRVSLRPAGILAKQAAALDQMSGGRGSSDSAPAIRSSKAEHEAFGSRSRPCPTGSALLEETVAAMRARCSREVPGREAPTSRRSRGRCCPRAIRSSGSEGGRAM